MHDVPYFDRFAPLYDLVLPETDSQFLEAGLGYADREVECVLDLGGGTGRAARVLPRSSLVLDASQPMLRRATDHELPTVRGDGRELPLASESVDAVVSVDAMHHFPAVEDVLQEAARVVGPGGVIVVRDFDPTSVRGRFLVLGERIVGFQSEFFTPDQMVGIFETAGLYPIVLESGFVYTVVGVKRAGRSGAES